MYISDIWRKYNISYAYQDAKIIESMVYSHYTIIDMFESFIHEITESMRDKLLNTIYDHKKFRYGIDKRPALPHEERGGFILTAKGEKKAYEAYKELFPECLHSEEYFEKYCGLDWE